MPSAQDNINQLTDHLFRHEAGKMVAVLTRIFGWQNLELAEDVVQEAFGKALQDWRFKVPDRPSAWLMQTAKNRAIDIVRRQRYQREFAEENAALLKSEYTAAPIIENLFMEHEIQDSQLRMIFACCHPALSEADQIALTLKTCSGLGVQEIASALLSNNEVIKKRLQRARNFVTAKGIDFNIPTGNELKKRRDVVLHTIYLIFNEGYNSSNKGDLIRKDLCEEAIRLAILLTENKYTDHPNCAALIALLSLLASRFEARLDENGEIVLLQDQDRNKWNHELINFGLRYLEKSIGGGEVCQYHLEAAIVAEHSTAVNFGETNWVRILSLYDLLLQMNSSPVVSLNRAIVVGKVHGPQKAIEIIHAIPEIDKLIKSQYLFPAILGELYLQLGDKGHSKEFLTLAIELTHSLSEKQLLVKKIQLLTA
ncbi:MAG: sigma-70 family RNA polymerase sigma factor [Cyclobacteriaceae bacterium]|nr:sigma-70 family RNA polymerase sigma factor [Cyclobacteriaceae bacterium]MDH4297612.1 sigma-70 family RNA polymerase sigma factor [Cyclobacteriaceae bacterium]MDH5250787.1 sigma-70 family RNA polymerase sigma factor [Cyclobacteriaceae bacterium]